MNATVEFPIVYTRQSTIGDLTKTQKGQVIMSELMVAISGRLGGGNEEATKESLGEGSEKMMQAMMLEMPLVALSSFGVLSEQELDALIGRLN